MKKFRFHCLSLAHTIPSKEFSACAFTCKATKFCKMMKERGHHVIFYGNEKSDVDCSEHVSVLPYSVYQKVYGSHDYHKQFFKYDLNDEAYLTYDKNCVTEIRNRYQQGDFLLCFWGAGNQRIANELKDLEGLIPLEVGIGYPEAGWATRFRVYESYSVRNSLQGPNHVAECREDWYHCVIPNYFDPTEFLFNDVKEDYFLCLGRVYSGKGVNVAIQVCEKLGKRLLIAGQGSIEDMGYRESKFVQYVGYADSEKRKHLLANAQGVFVASMYNEPFGGVAVEAAMSGTPVITTDWGAFAETVLHGLTGFRCRTFDHFCWAVENIKNINPYLCREWAISNFNLNKVSIMYEEYFQMVNDIYTGKGWYQEHPERTDLNWLTKKYPCEKCFVIKNTI